MFSDYPMQFNIRESCEEDFEARLSGIKNMCDSGVTLSLFRDVITNLRNGLSRPNERNELTISDWVIFFNEQFHPIQINETQLQAIFDYLTSYYLEVIGYNGNEYYTLISSQEVFSPKYFLEFITLKTLEL